MLNDKAAAIDHRSGLQVVTSTRTFARWKRGPIVEQQLASPAAGADNREPMSSFVLVQFGFNVRRCQL
jgi:hypothetical protein